MRVQEMFYLVNHALENWVDPQFSEFRKADRISGYSCPNAPQLVALLEPLRPFPEINELIEKIYSTDKTFCKGSVDILTQQEYGTVKNTMRRIKEILVTMQSMCEALGVEAESEGFDIKLPPNMTLPELAECTKDLNIAFSQCPLLLSNDEQIKFRGVDVGSSWLTFTVIGASVSNFITSTIAAIMKRVNVIRAQSLQIKQYEELVRQSELKTEILQQTVESNRAILKALTNTAARELAEEHDISSPEDIERIKHTLDILKDWTDKGLEIYAAIGAPEEIKAEFPSLETQAFSDFSVKKLEAHMEDEE